MKKIILMGRSECGKTTLSQALRGGEIAYRKTQYINHYDVVIDTPGEYAETASLGRALALYAYEADVVGLLCGATEPYCLFPPCVAAACTRPVIGIVTRIDEPGANPGRAQRWLELAGCRPVFRVSAYSGEGIWRILSYLKEPGDRLPWENAEEAERPAHRPFGQIRGDGAKTPLEKSGSFASGFFLCTIHMRRVVVS